MASLNNVVCGECGKTYSNNSNLKRHMKTHNSLKDMVCKVCKKTFTRRDLLRQHMIVHTQMKRLTCKQCPKTFVRKSYLQHHIRVKHPVLKLTKRKSTAYVPAPKRFKPCKSALNVFSEYLIKPTEEVEQDFTLFFIEMTPQLKIRLLNELQDKSAIKWYVVVKVLCSRITSEGETEFCSPFFRSRCCLQLTDAMVEENIDTAFANILESFDDLVNRGSGWILERIFHLEICIAKYHPLAASSYIPLPDRIALKKAVLNIQNEKDNKCLIWCILAHRKNIDRSKQPHRVSHYKPFEKEVDLGGIPTPVPLSKIPTIERLNEIRINVFGYEKEVFPLYISDRKGEDCCNLLLISNEETSHYCVIRNMSRLLGDLTHHQHASFYCFRCLHRFAAEATLKEHSKYCTEHDAQKVKMPSEENKFLQFKNIHYQQPLPYVIYADFESLIEKVDSCSRNSCISYSEKIAYHAPCGYAYVIVGPDGKSVKPPVIYRGLDAVSHFLEAILKEKEELAKKLTNIADIIMTPEDEQAFRDATTCHLCHKPLGNDRVKNHDHQNGKYLAALHNLCNLKFRLVKKIPIIFHNLKHYDGHLIMQQLGNIKDHDIFVIPTTMEKYISFTLSKKYKGIKVSLCFLDSFQFMSTSLEKLVSNLDREKFYILKENVSQNYNLLLRKGVYPYEYIDHMDTFNETSLPPISAFFSTLSGETLSQEDYTHAQNVWHTFGMKSLGEYHDLYVKSDVLLLADVFINFRKLCLISYQLDCLHLFTAPGLAWQSCLKMSGQTLELLTDIDMHLFIERGIRGGVSMISHRYSKANNYLIPQNFDSVDLTKYIMYLDANNLYGYAMSKPLPYGNFEWVTPSDNLIEHIKNLSDESSEGYIMEVDLEYPESLHDLHNDYPLAPEKFKITKEHLSPSAINFLNNNHFLSTTKLVPNLCNKSNYITYHRNLKFYLDQGLKLTRVHKILKFSQKDWLKNYIQFNTDQRKKATSSFEKDFFKLMNNAVYGKTMENVRKHKDVQLVNNERKAKKLVSAPSFKHFKMFDNDLVAVERLKNCIFLDKPIYVGFVILEVSKLHMYSFHYNHMKKLYAERAKLLFTDTDSLTYEITTEDVYKDMEEHKDMYDFSDYPTDHPLYSLDNKKKIGCFKDELNSKPGIEFVGLRSKMYSLLSSRGDKKKAKGVSRSVVEKDIKHQNYLDCLINSDAMKHVQHSIQSTSHQMYTIKQNKTSLSPFDDKRYISDNGITSFAYGHYEIESQKKKSTGKKIPIKN